MAFLNDIVAATRLRVSEAKESANLDELRARAEAHQPRGFRAALRRASSSGIAIIAELKQASPSKGVIRPNLHVAAIAREYEQGGAAALSVLTEQKYFQGSLANLCEASAATSLPCLRKDFIFDEFQLLEARANRADAILLITAILSDEQLRALYGKAHDLGLDVLCEVHSAAELERATAVGCDIIGVNSRDLRTFQVDMQTPIDLASRMPESVVRVAESGIHDGGDVNRLRASGYHAFLVGESFMRADNPGRALSSLIADATGVPLSSSRRGAD